MSISERTRKILWGKAGGRCSICRAMLVSESTDSDEPSVLGEEAHILPRADGGPDTYANLILLCSMHHKQVDNQRGHYTIDHLKELKRKHEKWTTSYGEPADAGPVRFISDPSRSTPKFFKIFTTGTAFWQFCQGALSFYPSWPDGLSEEHEDLIDNFFDDVRDWMDLSGGIDSYKEVRHACRVLDEHIEYLLSAGFVVGARDKFLLLTGGVSRQSASWRSVEVEIQPFNAAEPVGADGKLINLKDIRNRTERD